MTTDNLNDYIQWGAVIAIMAIAVWAILRRAIRLRRQLKAKNSNGCNCSCGCSDCHSHCPTKDFTDNHHQESLRGK